MAVELSQGYVSFSVSTEGGQRQIEQFINGWQDLAEKASIKTGQTLAKGLGDGTKVALQQAQAEHERYAIAVATSQKKAKDAQDANEAALRKVAIAEERLKEMQEAGKASQSQILAATDRLATARKAVSESALKVTAADKALKDAQDQARTSAERLAAAHREVDTTADKAGSSATSMSNKIKSGLAALATKIPNPFKPMEKDASDSGNKAGSNFTKEFKDKTSKLGDGLKAGIAGFMGGMASGAILNLSSSLKNFYDEARESQKVGATTAQIIQQTGGAAKISADEINKLAERISNKTGIDDEAIQSSANLLLTFKNVRNEVGAGSDIFNRATAAAQDMAAAGFGDAESAAKMLGKALNDPIKGVSALSRAGVTFSEQQKKQIENYVKQGDLLSAQKLIMKEVESQVGGVAAASATAGEKFATQISNLQENIGNAFMPMIDAVMGKAGEFVEWFGPAFQGVFDLFSKGSVTPDFASAFGVDANSPVVRFLLDVRNAVLGMQVPIQDVVAYAQDLGYMLSDSNIDPGSMGELGTVLGTVRDIGMQLWQSFQTNLMPGLLTIGGAIRDNVVPFVQHLGDLFVAHVLPMLQRFGEFVATQVLPILGSLATFIGTQVIPVVFQIATIIADTVIPALAQIYDVIFTYVLPPLMSFANFLIEVVMPKVMLLINEVIVPLFRLVASIVTWAVNNVVVPVLRFLGDFLMNVVGPAFKWLWERAVSPAIDAIVAGIQWLRDNGSQTFQEFIDRVKNVVEVGVGVIGKVWDGIKAAFQGPMKFVQDIINGLVDAFNTVSKIFGGPQVGHVSIVASGGRNQAGYAAGGVLPGFSPGRDNMHFYSPQWGSLSLSGGEAIMVPEFARLIGEQGVKMLNSAARAGRQTLAGVLGGMHFADGGIVNLRGHTFTAEFARRLQLAEAMARATFSITQGGFRPATSYSGTSHQGDAVDLAGPITTGVLIALRAVGIPSWDRTGKGNWMPHIHGVPLPFAGSAAGSAVWQARDYLAGGDGLGGRDNGPRVGNLLGELGNVALNLAAGAKSLIDWPTTFASRIAQASKINAPGAWGKMLQGVPQKVANTIADGAGKLLHLPGFADGTLAAPAGWGWVGESGPELVKFGGGERVYSNDAIRDAFKRGGIPDTITLVDRDGTFIARMHTESRVALSEAWSSGTVVARQEGASR